VSVIGVVVFLVVVGAVLAMVPMDSRIRTAAVVIVLLFAALWLLNATGVLHVQLR
jgi:hypothetical protein